MEAEIAMKCLFEKYPEIKATNKKPQWEMVLGLRKQKNLKVDLMNY